MSLHVTAPTGLGAAAEEEIHERFQTYDMVQVGVMKQGFMPIGKPHYAPPVLDPQELSTLTPEKYHFLTAQLSAWRSYTHEQTCDYECQIEECDNALKLLGPAIRKGIRTRCESLKIKKPAEDVIKDEVLTNPTWVEITLLRQKLLQKKKSIEPKHERYGRDLRILSRALEMRRQELGFGGTGDVGNVRREY